MSDAVFRTKSETTGKPVKLPDAKETTRGDEATEEVPYLDYEREHNHPYSVDYFKLGDTWQDPMGGFPEEVSVIEEYIEKKIKGGDLVNSISAIKQELKRIEEMNNINKEERAVVKIGTMAAYIRFLMETDKIKFNLKRYLKKKYANS